MNLTQYRKLQADRRIAEWTPRGRCPRCRLAESTCYCHRVVPFSPMQKFVILIHRDESRRAIATGRMAHLCVADSVLAEGCDFTEFEAINGLLASPEYYPMVLYPSPEAICLNQVPSEKRRELVPPGKRLLLFIFDGTWAKARKQRRLSRNLHGLPALSLSPTEPSRFRVRKQPRRFCLSTIEAIHQVIDLFGMPGGTPDGGRAHDGLMRVFDHLVQTQVAFEERSGRRATRGRRLPSSPESGRPPSEYAG